MTAAVEAAGYSVDVIWVLLCAVFVFFMQVGLIG